jgi:hypothetical protein
MTMELLHSVEGQILAGLVLLSLLLAVLALSGRRQDAATLRQLRLHAAGLEADLLALRQTLFQLNSQNRQDALEEQLKLLAEQQDQLRQRDANTGPYLNAIRDAQRGVSVEMLMANHGVNKGEAELILALHGPKTLDTR